MKILEYLKNQLQAMGQEASVLAQKRFQLEQQMTEINMRLTHLSGAITEVDRMIKEKEAKDEIGDLSKGRVSGSIFEAGEDEATDEDSVQVEEDNKSSS